MLRQSTTLAKNTFNIETAKARTMHWEPTLKFDDTRPNTRQQHNKEEVKEGLSRMTKYSAFDPGFTRQFQIPLMSRPPLSLFSFDEAMAGNQRGERNEEVKGALRQLPYCLPKYLRPKAGTTFSHMEGNTTTGNEPKRVGILQAMLYGVPDPENFSFAREIMAPGSLVHKILHGVKEMDDGEGVVAFAKVTVPKVEKVEAEANAVVKGVQVRIEVEERLERDDGASMIAK